MFLLIATYGLRTSEVVAITLDDPSAGSSAICKSISARPLRVGTSLTNEVMCALVKHLKPGLHRPRHYRQIFLKSARAPIGALKPIAVTDAFGSWSSE